MIATHKLTHDVPTVRGTYAQGLPVIVLGIPRAGTRRVCFDPYGFHLRSCHCGTIPSRWLAPIDSGPDLTVLQRDELVAATNRDHRKQAA